MVLLPPCHPSVDDLQCTKRNKTHSLILHRAFLTEAQEHAFHFGYSLFVCAKLLSRFRALATIRRIPSKRSRFFPLSLCQNGAGSQVPRTTFDQSSSNANIVFHVPLPPMETKACSLP